MRIGYHFQLYVIISIVVTVLALPLWLMVDVPITKWLNIAAMTSALVAVHVLWSWLQGRRPFNLDEDRRPSLAELRERYALEEDDEDEVPEEAEAFVSQMEDFASLDWFLWNHASTRLMVRQKHYWN